MFNFFVLTLASQHSVKLANLLETTSMFKKLKIYFIIIEIDLFNGYYRWFQ